MQGNGVRALLFGGNGNDTMRLSGKNTNDRRRSGRRQDHRGHLLRPRQGDQCGPGKDESHDLTVRQQPRQRVKIAADCEKKVKGLY